MAGDYKIPFDEDGNLLDYVRYEGQADEWREKTWFEAELTYDGYSRGRSSVKFYFKDKSGHRYGMFATDVALLLDEGVIWEGEIYGLWTFVKRGRNYG